jgi:hypothetical protein
MAIADAKKFIRESQLNRDLRKQVNGMETTELLSGLVEIGYEFTMDEFEEAVNMIHVQCQFETEADDLMQTAMWFKMLALGR